jgi:hypothetical protein
VRATVLGFVAGPLAGSEGLTAVGANAGAQGDGQVFVGPRRRQPHGERSGCVR